MNYDGVGSWLLQRHGPCLETKKKYDKRFGCESLGENSQSKAKNNVKNRWTLLQARSLIGMFIKTGCDWAHAWINNKFLTIPFHFSIHYFLGPLKTTFGLLFFFWRFHSNAGWLFVIIVPWTHKHQKDKSCTGITNQSEWFQFGEKFYSKTQTNK